MEIKPKFSIGIPAYKSQYLSECISSILDQSFSDFELIIVNDCSPHPVNEVVANFCDPRIRYFINERNIGAENVANNYNNCLDRAKGDFFVLMGDDDKMGLNYLKTFLDLIDRYPELDLYHCRSKIIDENSNPVGLTPSCPEYETVYDNIWHRIHEKREQFISDFVFRTAPLKDHGGFYYLPLGWGTDDITAYIAMTDKGIAHTSKPLLNYRRHSDNISAKGSYVLKMRAILEQQKWLNEFLEARPEDEDDLLLYDNIRKTLPKQVQKQKVYLMASSFDLEGFQIIWKWIFARESIQVSLLEILYSFIVHLRSKKAKEAYQVYRSGARA